MDLIELLSALKTKRQSAGLTQAELSNLSGVSVPAIQILESGKGNPSLSTLDALSSSLGVQLKIELRARTARWPLLVHCGAPLLLEKSKSQGPRLSPPTLSLLRDCLREACLELEASHDPRKKECVQALLLALAAHYPKIFSRYFSQMPFIHFTLKPVQITGRLTQLKRQALSRLAAYL